MPVFDWLVDGAPLLLDRLLCRHAAAILRLGLLPALRALAEGRDLPGGGEGEWLLPHVLAALCEGRRGPLEDYLDGLAQGVDGLPEVLAEDLERWRSWARLPLAAALTRMLQEPAAGAEEAAARTLARGWLRLASGRAAEARAALGEAGRLAGTRRRLSELARRLEEAATAADPSPPPSRGRVAEGSPPPATADAAERLRLREGCFLACHRHGRMVGSCPPFRDLLRHLRRAASDRLPVLLVGETGTGKELAVEYLHGLAFPAGQPLVAVNCGGLSETLAEAELFGAARGAFTGAVEREGLVAQAEGGTLFLDEFGALPASVQARLLRFLESGVYRRVGEARERRVQARVVAATCEGHRLEAGVRQDLLHRVAGRVIEVPSLDRRREDLPLLVRAFLHEAGVADPRRHPLCRPQAQELLARARWPGNIRQLRHAILRLAAAEEEELAVELAALAPAAPAPAGAGEPPADLPLREAVARFEWARIQAALAESGQDRRRAALRLGISLPTLYARLKGAAGPGPLAGHE